jgi:hypothetical protein
MKVDCRELLALASVVKRAQVAPTLGSPLSRIPHRKKVDMTSAYPSYGKSLLSQLEEDPTAAGGQRGLAMGALGTVLGALAARIMSDNPYVVGAGGLAGGGLGAYAGFRSGEQESASERSRLLFLKRLGVTRPGELEALINRYPEAAKKVMEEGEIV